MTTWSRCLQSTTPSVFNHAIQTIYRSSFRWWLFFKDKEYYFSTSILKNERKLSFGNFERLLLRGYKREVSISFGKPSKSKLTFVILARKTLKISFLTKSRRNFFCIEFQNVDFGRNSRQNEKQKNCFFFFQIVDFGRFSRQNELLKCCLRQQFKINFTIFLSHFLKRFSFPVIL